MRTHDLQIIKKEEVGKGWNHAKPLNGSQWPPGLEVATIFSEAIYTKLI